MIRMIAQPAKLMLLMMQEKFIVAPKRIDTSVVDHTPFSLLKSLYIVVDESDDDDEFCDVQSRRMPLRLVDEEIIGSKGVP